jgi:hypothetical protein
MANESFVFGVAAMADVASEEKKAAAGIDSMKTESLWPMAYLSARKSGSMQIFHMVIDIYS